MGFPADIDPLIRPMVALLNGHGFKTFESCQGGEGHCYLEPAVRFEGGNIDLIRAIELCTAGGFIVSEGRIIYRRVQIWDESQQKYLGDWWDKPFNEITFVL